MKTVKMRIELDADEIVDACLAYLAENHSQEASEGRLLVTQEQGQARVVFVAEIEERD